MVRTPGSGRPRWDTVLRALRRLADADELVCYGIHRPVVEGREDATVAVAVLDGPPHAFAPIEEAQRGGRLSDLLGIDVLRLERTTGATVRAEMRIGASGHMPRGRDPALVIGPSPSHVPLRLMGLAVRPSDPAWLMLIPHVGESRLGGEALRREIDRLWGYVITVLALPGEDLHVNLSAFEQSRVIPRTLTKTGFGRVLVEQDCLLKQLVASLLHPDCPSGRAYWSEVRALATRLGQTPMPLESHQRVWVVPDSASITEKPLGRTSGIPLPPGYELGPEEWAVVLTSSSARVLTEIDYIALRHQDTTRRPAGPTASPDVHLAMLDIFRRTVLPVIEEDVARGERFAPLRQGLDAVVLAKWYRERLADPGVHRALLALAEEARTLLGASADEEVQLARRSEEIGPSDEGAPEWLRAAYRRYLDLYENGVFECARGEEAEDGTLVTRIYFAGGVDSAWRASTVAGPSSDSRCWQTTHGSGERGVLIVAVADEDAARIGRRVRGPVLPGIHAILAGVGLPQ